MNLFNKNFKNPYLNPESINCIINDLIKASLRSDAYGTEHDLLLASYSALNKIFEEMPDELIQIGVGKIDIFLRLLEETINQPHQAATQIHICSALHSIFGRSIEGSITEEIADKFVQMMIKIFQTRSTVFEEGLQALGTLADNMHERFEKYVSILAPFIDWAIEQPSSAISKGGVMVAGDFSRALKDRYNTYVGTTIPKLLIILANDQINFDVKIRAIDTLADFGSHTTREFSKFLNDILRYIESASSLSLNLNLEIANPDLHEYLLELRESIISFYVGIVQGLNDIQCADMIFAYLPKIVDYSMMIVQDQYKPNSNIHTSVAGVIGDIATFYTTRSASFIKVSRIEAYLAKQSGLQNEEIASVVEYARERIKLI